MKKLITLGLATILAFAMGTTAFAAEEASVSVNGNATIFVEPDLATIYLNVEAIEDTPTQAQQTVNDIVVDLTATMQEAGIAKEDILTDYSSVRPLYSYSYDYDYSEEPEIIGYECYMNLSVETTDIDNVGKYIDLALESGATSYNYISFTLQDPAAAYAQALTLASQHATDSAKTLANAFGRTLGAVVSVEEYSQSSGYDSAFYNAYEEEVTMMDAGGADYKETQISYRDVEVSARIQATFALQ